MKSYGFVESASLEDLQKAVVMFISDSMFEVPVHLARESLKRRRGETSDVESFHFEVGNPFPGPYQGVAHHCVEIIYQFEAFHDALTNADNGILRPYQEPGNIDAADIRSTDSNGSDSGIDSSPSPSQPPHPHIKPLKDSQTYTRTNVELCHALQDHWLDFIARDQYAPLSKSDEITVYGVDRGTRTESLIEGPFWQRRRKCWELVVQDLDAMALARQLIRSP
jgi:hypothetical protein